MTFDIGVVLGSAVPIGQMRAILLTSRAYDRKVVTIEFTVEPFHEGSPGPHVTEATRAVERFAQRVDVGPFGTAADVVDEIADQAIAALTRAALDHGATHINLALHRADPGASR